MPPIKKLQVIIPIIITIIAIFFTIPNVLVNNSNSILIPSKKIKLGLDLQGGLQLLLKVDLDSYRENNINSITDNIKQHFKKKKIGYRNLTCTNDTINFVIKESNNINAVKKIISNIDKNLQVTINNNNIFISYSNHSIKQQNEKIINQALGIIRMRIDNTGTKEPIIQRQGESYISLQLAGVTNTEQIKSILGKTAQLTFHLLNENIDVNNTQKGYIPYNSKILPLIANEDIKNQNSPKFLIVYKKVMLRGDHLNNAQASFNKDSQPIVSFSFNNLGAKKFAEITTNNQGKRLAIVLDNQIISTPVINEPITSGDGIISGNFTTESATNLALLLKSGALPAPITIVEERTIGPTLGIDSIESGKLAGYIGFISVCIFMILYYGILGVFASVTLIISIVYIIALLSILQVTVTLPGIAGIILTIGMAVDANVLIYERIREELLQGNSKAYSIKIGFQSAINTITDSNITTLIAAFFLYLFGVGTIKGFAVTLTIGIISSMYTAIVITKLLINIWLKYVRTSNLGLI